ncbi:MAG: hypothetical protein H0V72_15950 [Bradyrhizobium sp.]|nr:hypothetical protein [Bradyrhizobium sp.]
MSTLVAAKLDRRVKILSGLLEGQEALNALASCVPLTFLIFLTSGAGAVWRSNKLPPRANDARAYVRREEVGIDYELMSDMLDTPLFKGEGETFEPIHKTVAEFLAGKALADAVIGTPSKPAFPFARALALVTGADGRPPTELRGLFAWFAAHLAVAAEAGIAIQLIEADPLTILSYGDAAVFETPARRAILHSLGKDDPYFRASEVGVTAVGGLAGEDLAEDFAALLADKADGTHRLMTVFEALTSGRPIPSLRPKLRAHALDVSRPEWQRRRAINAYLNGIDDARGRSA